ncbi:Pls/PosA family non-ribosomal peptide synthetase [Gordonia iterans]
MSLPSTFSTLTPARRAVRRLEYVFEASVARCPDAIALECDGYAVTYAQLDARANQLAHYLRGQGIAVGVRVALLLPRSLDMYVSLLGALKAGATFVPIDPGAPADRVAYVIDDAGVDFVLTTTELLVSVQTLPVRWLTVDTAGELLDRRPTHRPPLDPFADPDPACYILYTSGSSGRPKGVEVAQSSICNFLDIVPEIYDVRPGDRVYQGMTISFDFSIEEIWPTWARGATLVAGPNDSRRLGAELADFLDEHAITTVYCVPTLLATIPRDLPHLRNLLVGGEACPRELVERWSKPGRRILNTYGPTEATVTATWGELRPGRPVTIGRPLPTYSVVILDEDRYPVPAGEVGEICIGGPGVARGYVGRPDLTADRFIDHPLAPPGSTLYRTGDLGRWTEDGEIEYLGRADAEVKIRGHRIDLGEIESVLLEDPVIGEAVVGVVDSSGAAPALAAYVVFKQEDLDDRSRDQALARLRQRLTERLPGYMVPTFLDVLAALPTMPSGKVDRKRLPAPTGRLLAGSDRVTEPGTATETWLRQVWAQALGLDAATISVEADFFTELGGHSLAAAAVVSALRADRPDRPVAVRDLYSHPTVRCFAAHLDEHTAPAPRARTTELPLRHSSRRVAAAGTVQAVSLYLLLLVITLPVTYVYTVNDGAVSVAVLTEMMTAILVTYLVVRWILPVLLTRPLAAGISPGRYRLWGTTYLRLWLLDLVLALGALPSLSGSALMSTYLRALGASIGRRTTIATSTISLPTLVQIDDDAAIGYGAVLRPWRVEAGRVLVDRIVVGAGACVGAHTVLEPGTTIGPRAAIGAQSVITPGQDITVESRWAGSPATPTDRLDDTVETLMRQSSSRSQWKTRHLVASVLGLLALEVGAVAVLLPGVAFVWWALLTGGVIMGFAATLAAGPIYVLTVCTFVAVGKRILLHRSPAGIHPVRSSLGVRKWMVDKLLEFSLTFTNPLYATLYTAPWLRLLGARIGRGSEVSTVAHIDPDLLTVGADSFVADMASVGSASFANGRMLIAPTTVGRGTFVGNAAVIPAGADLGDDALLGVGTLPPPGPVPAGSSWLGSPTMHLPRRQDSENFDPSLTFRPTTAMVRRRLAIEFFRVTLPPTVLGVGIYLYLTVLSALASGRDLLIPALVAPLVSIATAVAVIAFCAAVKRNVVGTYRPRVEPLWSGFVRRSEFATGLYEGAAVPIGVGMLVGTPILPVVLRWFGARIGRRTWIGTTYLTEFDLVHIGDDAVIGTEASLQTHLFEDRVMKMSVVTVADGATIGTRAIVLYDAVIGTDAQLGSLSLAMKGEHLPEHTRWLGIPAEAAQ